MVGDRIVLRADWDTASELTPGRLEATRHFCGRRRIVSMLSNEVVRGASGSILVCGQRGAGKSAIVHQALVEAESTLLAEGRKYLVVPINAAQFEHRSDAPRQGDASDDGRHVSARRVICAVIRSLAKSMPEDDSRKPAADQLFEKAFAASWRQESGGERTDESRMGHTSTRQIGLQLANDWVRSLLPPIAGTTIASLCALPVGNPVARIAIVLMTAVAVTTATTFALSVQHVRSQEKRITRRAARAVAMDNSTASLEHDLERLHAEIATDSRLIYVIDEMDKLDPRTVLEALKCFKPLLTGSRAVFIFVGDDKLYDGVSASPEKKSENPSRSEWYTCFTSRYYVEPARTDELLQYMNAIVADKSMDESSWETLQASLIFDAGHDFFDLKAGIRNRVTSFDALHRPVLEGPICSTDFQKANYQRALRILLEPLYLGRNPLEWRANDSLWNTALDTARKVLAARAGDPFDSGRGNSTVEQLTNDFYELLYRLGRFSRDAEREQKRRDNQPHAQAGASIRYWKVQAELSRPPTALGEPTEYEQLFLVELDQLMAYALALHNACAMHRHQETRDVNSARDEKVWRQLNDFGYDFASHFRTYVPVRNDILARENPERRNARNREEIEQLTQQLRSVLDGFTSGFRHILAHLIARQYKQWTFDQAATYQIPGFFGDGGNEHVGTVMQQLSATVIAPAGLHRRISLVSNGESDLYAIQRELRSSVSTDLVVAVQYLQFPSVPADVATVRVLDDHRSFAKQLVALLKRVDAFLGLGSEPEDLCTESRAKAEPQTGAE